MNMFLDKRPSLPDFKLIKPLGSTRLYNHVVAYSLAQSNKTERIANQGFAGSPQTHRQRAKLKGSLN
jgi:hypothetical protein